MHRVVQILASEPGFVLHEVCSTHFNVWAPNISGGYGILESLFFVTFSAQGSAACFVLCLSAPVSGYEALSLATTTGRSSQLYTFSLGGGV